MSKTQSPFFSEVKDKAKLIFTHGEMLKTFQELKGSASGFDDEIDKQSVKSELEDQISKITSKLDTYFDPHEIKKLNERNK